MKGNNQSLITEENLKALHESLKTKKQFEMYREVMRTIAPIVKSEKHFFLFPEIYPYLPENESFDIFGEPFGFSVKNLLSNTLALDPMLKDFTVISLSGLLLKIENEILQKKPQLRNLINEIDDLSLRIILALLLNSKIPCGIYIGAVENEDEIFDRKTEIGTDIYGRKRIIDNLRKYSATLYLNDDLCISIIDGESLRSGTSLTKESLEKSECIKKILENSDLPVFTHQDYTFFTVVSSPLLNPIPPQKKLNCNVTINKITSKDLKPFYITRDDLKNCQPVIDQDEVKIICSRILNTKNTPFKSPAVQKNDILVTVRRKNSFNAALICCETPNINIEKKAFVPNKELAIVRLNPEKYSSLQVENFAKLIGSEVKSFSKAGRPLSISILRNIVKELLDDGEFKKILNIQNNMDTLITLGRRKIRKLLLKYLFVTKTNKKKTTV